VQEPLEITESVYKLREERIKQLLMDCLEEHYGSLRDVVVRPDAALEAVVAMQEQLDIVKTHLLRQ